MKSEIQTSELKPNPNPDPITGEPGSHPVATAAGAVAVCAAGAALGSMAGPIGTAIGGVAGAIAGAVGGNVVGESIDPTVKDESVAHIEDRYANGGHPYGKFIPSYSSDYEGSRHYTPSDPAEPADVTENTTVATPPETTSRPKAKDDPSATTLQP